MSKHKRNQIYSFKAISSENSSQQGFGQTRQSIQFQGQDEFFTNTNYSSQYSNKIKSGIYRHEKTYQNHKFQPQLKVFSQADFNKKVSIEDNNFFQTQKIQIHPKILSLDSQIEENVKRRLALEQQLKKLKKIQSPEQKYNKILSNNQRNTTKQEGNFVLQKQFALRNLQTHFIDQLVQKGDQKHRVKNVQNQTFNKSQEKFNKNDRYQKINKNMQILTNNHFQTILQNGFKDSKFSKEFYDLNTFMQIDSKQTNFPHSEKKQKKPIKQILSPTPPPITAIQIMISRLTFPQVPKQNVQKLLEKCHQLNAIHQSHSDIVYLLMVGSFHTGNFHDVRKFFKEILTFKKFQLKAYWVAAEAQYGLQNYERCIKLSDFCMTNLDDKFLPRFLYLKAKCYNEEGNFTNSIVCYNQLIRIKPKISEYYLQRAILYDKLGYQKECKQDYLMFGILKPDAKKYLQEKIIIESNDAKRKELLQIYKKLV